MLDHSRDCTSSYYHRPIKNSVLPPAHGPYDHRICPSHHLEWLANEPFTGLMGLIHVATRNQSVACQSWLGRCFLLRSGICPKQLNAISIYLIFTFQRPSNSNYVSLLLFDGLWKVKAEYNNIKHNIFFFLVVKMFQPL